MLPVHGKYLLNLPLFCVSRVKGYTVLSAYGDTIYPLNKNANDLVISKLCCKVKLFQNNQGAAWQLLQRTTYQIRCNKHSMVYFSSCYATFDVM